jgi:hypothetical protein
MAMFWVMGSVLLLAMQRVLDRRGEGCKGTVTMSDLRPEKKIYYEISGRIVQALEKSFSQYGEIMLVETLETIQKRLTWTNGKKLLRSAGCEVGQGWTKTIAKLLEAKDSVNLGILQDRLIEHILCGDKLTKIYPISESDRVELQNYILTLSPSDTLASKLYPCMITSDKIDSESAAMDLVQVTKTDDGIGVVLSSIVSLKTREEIEFSSFDNPELMREKYDEVIGVKIKKVQVLSIVWVPHHRSTLEIRVDYPRGMTEVLAHGFHSQIKQNFNNWTKVQLGSPVNLFPAVRRFYDDNKEGIVTEITFATTTAAIKNERMMRRTNQLDQRQELYHLKGKEGLGTEIALYRITVEWAFVEDKIMYAPSLTLAASGPGGAGQGHDPIISGALIEGCIRTSDYETLIERLGKKASIVETPVTGPD